MDGSSKGGPVSDLSAVLTTYAARLRKLDEAHGVAVTQIQGGPAALARFYERRALFELVHRME